ncbi:hypothetical protein A8C32_01285 [Flavivirga aquatica]|uniref:Uncharacterized protein n=2 Tax=Flavivirga aquatica TaxID=1849968 RepID=A0A1E5T9S1_9FLAO|nr:hypothetical protein A8C32_01285 [Flavivirga aquatica]
MQTILTISPAIQNYGVDFVKRWNVSWISPSERMPYEAMENNDEPKLIEYHFEDEKGNRIDKNEINIGEIIYLKINTKNAIGKSLQINLDDNYKDFEHNGNTLINDVLNNIKITDDTCKVQLKAVKQKEE